MAERVQENDRLTLAREGDEVTDAVPVSLQQVAEDCWETVETGGATLTVETDLTLHADRTRLKQLLENLFRNCVEHGSTDSRPEADGREGSKIPRTERDDVPQATGRSPVTDGEAVDSVEHGASDGFAVTGVDVAG